MSTTYNFRTPALVKVYSRLIVSTYYKALYDTRVVRYLGSYQPKPVLAPVADTVAATAGTITITFNTPVVLTGSSATAQGWSITPPGSPMVIGVSVTGVAVAGNIVTLTTTEQTGGGAYTLNFPEGLIFSTPGGLAFTGPFQRSVTGAATHTPIISANAIDSRTVDILFARAVQPAGALNPANYVLSPPVAVLGVVQLTPNGFRLTTAPQSTGQVYTLTASNIYDLAFNPI